jgi:hypothetical protein
MTDDLNAGARKLLNMHGYSFQESLLKHFAMLSTEGVSRYRFVASEIPIDLHGRHTSIDFALSRPSEWMRAPDQLVVAECKRVDPAVGRWLFARNTFRRPDNRPHRTFASVVQHNPQGQGLTERTYEILGPQPYHIGLEMKTQQRGDGMGSGKSAIDTALAQVFRGASGLMNLLANQPDFALRGSDPTFVVPVIFTTAELHAVDDDLSGADLQTGDLSNLTTRELPHLWFEMNLSRDLRPSVQADFQDEGSARAEGLVALHPRAALIVSAKGDGIRGFVTSYSELLSRQL